ncbi:VOC family protein [Solitalea canadensis]|uniref:Lactoylglutathione lyase family protein n=1 Tax=Solitalea canadensis (strain ATCC 29591 / DSM 3403 / JCM 21819 / LMG 8368 / NBRC 15130 / NCIMB 12057 / USAM 9D) TaxID=929556 RepID=H8KMZ0_SOLCM|nr:VOC family protein [Solitalea canadensis]AFD09069.1 lactoylglutathione lyase family protein [Solitalea canadensis DSM 3403]
MENTHVLRGLATINFYATDHAAAKKWYSEFLGVEPYFNVPGYTEFRIGDYQHELGIIDSSYAPEGYSTKPSGAIAHWHVDDLTTTLTQLIAMGAKEYLPITDHSQGKGTFVTASVVDPFGNVLGLMTNVHYLEILNQKNS